MGVKAIGKIASPKEMTHMKRTIAIAFLASTMVMALSTASAQSKAKATIPFNFRVGSALLPAGSYEIDSSQTRVIWFHSEDGHSNAAVLAVSTSGETKAAEKLVFNRYGDRYFLSETRNASGESEMTFARSKLEKSIRSEQASRNNEGQTLVALK
jgi:hypothetical protein